MITKLPHWVLTEKHPAFYDTESKTAVGQTAKLYGKMQELIEDYNRLVDEINSKIETFINETNIEQEEYEEEINKIINSAEKYMKDNLVETIKQLNKNHELDNMIIASISDVESAMYIKQNNFEKEVNSKISSLSNGTPLVATSINEMTNTSRIYVNTTDGNWYYHNGSAWVSGGVYQAIELGMGSITNGNLKNEVVAPLNIKGHSIINLFDYADSSKLTGYKLNTSGGVVEATNYTTTDYIKVEPNMDLYSDFGMPTTGPVVCFYDQNKNFLSSLTSTTDWAKIEHFVTPANCYYIRMCSSKDTLKGEGKGIYTTSFAPAQYIPFGKFSIEGLTLNANSIEKEMLKDNIITDSKIQSNSLDYKKLQGLVTNLMNANDENNLKDYRLNTSGGVVAGANYTTTDYIEVGGDMDLYCDFAMATTGNAIAFYDINKKFISGVTVAENWKTLGAVKTPQNTKYIRLCSATDSFTSGAKGCYTNATQKPNEYIEFGKYILNANLEINPTGSLKTIRVNQDGTGDFTSLRSAIESTNATEKFVIEISEGIYDVFADFTEEEINSAEYKSDDMTSFCGLMVNGNITLKGIGAKENIIIKGELDPDKYSYDIREQISTLNLQGNITLENLIITAKNIRYAIHDDFKKENTETNCINCDFIHFLNSAQNGQNNAYGMGTRSGKITNFEDCYFNPRFYQHTNYGFTKPSVTTLKNCIATESLIAHDMGSGQKDKVYFKGCNAPFIRYSWYNNNLNAPNIEIICDNNIPLFYLNEGNFITSDVKFIKNNGTTTIGKGALIKRTDINAFDVLTTNESHLLYGIALEDIPAGEYGKVITKNYISKDDTGINPQIGNKYKIENGSLVPTTENDYVAVCDCEDFIKLI